MSLSYNHDGANDLNLPDRYKSGDFIAFHMLWQQHYDPDLWPQALRLSAGNLRLAEEVSDYAYHRLGQHSTMVGYEPDRPWVSYAFRQLKWGRASILRRPEWRTGPLVEPELIASPPPSVDFQDQEDVQQIVRHALDRLPHRQREVIRLRWLENWNRERIAEALTISLWQVDYAYKQGMTILRSVLESKGFGRS